MEEIKRRRPSTHRARNTEPARRKIQERIERRKATLIEPRQCTTCGVWKDGTEFSKRIVSGKVIRYKTCKGCLPKLAKRAQAPECERGLNQTPRFSNSEITNSQILSEAS